MTPRDFVYWLNGYLELGDAEISGIPPLQVQMIQDHLKLVFQKETPDRSVVPFLGNEREVFDDKYINEALGIDVEIEKERMKTEDRIVLKGSSDYSFVKYPLYPDSDFSTLFDLDNPVPISC